MKRLSFISVLFVLGVLFWFSELHDARGHGLGILFIGMSLILLPPAIWLGSAVVHHLLRQYGEDENFVGSPLKKFCGPKNIARIILILMGVGLAMDIGDFYARFGSPESVTLETVSSTNAWSLIATTARAISASLWVVVSAVVLIWYIMREKSHAQKDKTSS